LGGRRLDAACAGLTPELPPSVIVQERIALFAKVTFLVSSMFLFATVAGDQVHEVVRRQPSNRVGLVSGTLKSSTGSDRRTRRHLRARRRRLLSGHRHPPPFTGRNMVEICTRHTYDEPEPPSRRRILPQDLEHVILSCPAKDPALRREHPPLVVCRVDLRRRLDDLGHSLGVSQG
jgi:hypothetical protein